MTFPVDKFSDASFELVPDTRLPSARLFRYRSKGSKDPYYMISLTSSMLDYAEGMGVAAVIDSYMGGEAIFPLPNPFPEIASHTGLTLAQVVQRGARQIVIAGLPTNRSNAVPAGDFIQISGSEKAYQIAIGDDSDSTGRALVTLSQPVIQAYSASAQIAYGKHVEFQVCVEDRSSCEVSAKNSKFIVHDVELIEQL
ncbi:hypothetical protein CA267_001720 [Alteromonas pelagimontana]|uniref:Uncharacterized protein n=1 Tax=Alteromonas pelagimontana TaxID=1858656 RepID=A0A6M4M8W6_9ALTE|nr:hypothetical protein [Alteromonas pelagimontana]QJR79603.1 hypothetical protein CA267_001720 [Alteromonas pelagimontana]